MSNLNNKTNINWWYSIDGSVYTGERQDIRDIKIPARPSKFHTFDKVNKKWTLDNNTLSAHKILLISEIDNEYKFKVDSLHLNSTEKLALRDKCDILINKIKGITDPVTLQEFTIDI